MVFHDVPLCLGGVNVIPYLRVFAESEEPLELLREEQAEKDVWFLTLQEAKIKAYYTQPVIYNICHL